MFTPGALVPNLDLPFHSLRMEKLVLQQRLGCSAEERAKPQEVRVTLELRFAKGPQALVTDDLGGTVCYARLAQAIQGATCPARIQIGRASGL